MSSHKQNIYFHILPCDRKYIDITVRRLAIKPRLYFAYKPWAHGPTTAVIHHGAAAITIHPPPWCLDITAMLITGYILWVIYGNRNLLKAFYRFWSIFSNNTYLNVAVYVLYSKMACLLLINQTCF